MNNTRVTMDHKQWLDTFVSDEYQTGQLITNYYYMTPEDQKTVRIGIYPATCMHCVGEGEVYEQIPHECNCEYCDMDHEDDEGELMECPDCGGTGEKLDYKKLIKAVEVIRRYVPGMIEVS